MMSGRLRHKIVIQNPSESNGSYGETVTTWGTFATVWASVEPLNGREYFESQQTNAEVNFRFRIRYTASITPKMRISYDSRTFDIISVINVNERDRETVLMAKEVV